MQLIGDLPDTGKYRIRETECPEEIARLQRFRARCFGVDAERDADRFDPICRHIAIEERSSGALVCCFRMLPLERDAVAESYSAQFYDLSSLQAFDGPIVEVGRFCVDPGKRDPDILRLAWASITAYVDAAGVKMLIGCTSFRGTETRKYHDAFAMLKARYLAPERWLPRVKAPDVFRYAAKLPGRPDLKKALAHMPPLLRSYLMMGGWVSDHAVVDRQMNTLHVFTALEIGAIPPARKRLLRALV